MAQRLDHAKALLENATSELNDIDGLYRASLQAKAISPKLLIEIKNFLENLRSALDFVARETYERYCTPKANVQVYFPIMKKSSTEQDFANFMNGRFPGLERANPRMFAKLKSFQFFASPENESLCQFGDLCSENKHEQLSHQDRIEFQEKKLTIPGGVSFGWTSGVTFYGNISFGGRPIDTKSQLPITRPGDRLEIINWVDFRFDSIGVSALPFLGTCLERVGKIVSETVEELNS